MGRVREKKRAPRGENNKKEGEEKHVKRYVV